MTALLSRLGRFTMTALVLAVAALFGFELWDYYVEAPWTRDGRVRADIVAVAPDVSGLVTDVLVQDNQIVKRGDVLFKIDRERFALALQEAQAAAEGRLAALTQASSDLARYKQLSDNVVSRQKFEQVLATQQLAAAAYKEALAQRDVAKLNLDRSEVRASVNGAVTNFDLRPGAYVSAGKGVFALVDSDSLHIEGYFEETKLPRIHPGDRVSVRLMGEFEDPDRARREHRRRDRGSRAQRRRHARRQCQSDLQLGQACAENPGPDHARRDLARHPSAAGSNGDRFG